jgi:hypothetical protein
MQTGHFLKEMIDRLTRYGEGLADGLSGREDGPGIIGNVELAITALRRARSDLNGEDRASPQKKFPSAEEALADQTAHDRMRDKFLREKCSEKFGSEG